MALPVLRPHDSQATAIFIETIPGSGGRRRLRTERVYVRDGAWVVRRNGRLVRLADQHPPADALLKQDGHVEADLTGWWPSLREFARTYAGIDPDSISEAA